LFKTELVEKLRQVVSNGDIDWLNREKNKIDQWTEERFEFDLDNSVDGYQDRYFNALFECAKKIITPDDDFSDTLRLIEAKTGFSTGFVADCCNLLKANKLYSTVEMIEIPILLVEPRRNRAGSKNQPGDNGFAAYLCLEKVNLEVCSKPYPHPDNMFCTSVDRQVERAINDAFTFLLQKKGEKEVPVFRWWVKPTNRETNRELVAIEGPSLYGAFVVGMYALTYDFSMPKNMTVTTAGDFQGHLSGIKGLKEKLDAAADEKLKTVVVCEGQDKRELTGEQKTQKKLLKEAKNADELLGHFFRRKLLKEGFIRKIKYSVIAFLVVVAVIGGVYLIQEHASLSKFVDTEFEELNNRNKVLDSNLSIALTELWKKGYKTASIVEKVDLLLMGIRAHEQDSAIIYTENPKFVIDDKFATTMEEIKALLNKRRSNAGYKKTLKILDNKFSECSSVPPRNWYEKGN
jgi:hypothetical protein